MLYIMYNSNITKVENDSSFHNKTGGTYEEIN